VCIETTHGDFASPTFAVFSPSARMDLLEAETLMCTPHGAGWKHPVPNKGCPLLPTTGREQISIKVALDAGNVIIAKKGVNTK
jgi:hypothetical protein